MTEPAKVQIPRLSMPYDVTPAEDWPDRLGESAEEAEHRHVTAAAVRRRLWEMNRPARFADADLGSLAPYQHHFALTQFVRERDDVLTLVLWGPAGTGKTHAAYALGNRLVADGARAACWSSTALNDAFRPGNDPTAYVTAQTCDLLLLDDLGRERMTEWTLERLQLVLDERWANRRRTIITTNLDGGAFQARYGDPIVDRLRDSCWRLKIDGPSRRAPAPW